MTVHVEHLRCKNPEQTPSIFDVGPVIGLPGGVGVKVFIPELVGENVNRLIAFHFTGVPYNTLPPSERQALSRHRNSYYYDGDIPWTMFGPF